MDVGVLMRPTDRSRGLERRVESSRPLEGPPRRLRRPDTTRGCESTVETNVPVGSDPETGNPEWGPGRRGLRSGPGRDVKNYDIEYT